MTSSSLSAVAVVNDDTIIIIYLGPDLRQCYDYLTIMPKLDDGRLFYKTFTKNAGLFLGTIHLQNRKIV